MRKVGVGEVDGQEKGSGYQEEGGRAGLLAVRMIYGRAARLGPNPHPTLPALCVVYTVLYS